MLDGSVKYEEALQFDAGVPSSFKSVIPSGKILENLDNNIFFCIIQRIYNIYLKEITEKCSNSKETENTTDFTVCKHVNSLVQEEINNMNVLDLLKILELLFDCERKDTLLRKYFFTQKSFNQKFFSNILQSQPNHCTSLYTVYTDNPGQFYKQVMASTQINDQKFVHALFTFITKNLGKLSNIEWDNSRNRLLPLLLDVSVNSATTQIAENAQFTLQSPNMTPRENNSSCSVHMKDLVSSYSFESIQDLPLSMSFNSSPMLRKSSPKVMSQVLARKFSPTLSLDLPETELSVTPSLTCDSSASRVDVYSNKSACLPSPSYNFTIPKTNLPSTSLLDDTSSATSCNVMSLPVMSNISIANNSPNKTSTQKSSPVVHFSQDSSYLATDVHMTIPQTSASMKNMHLQTLKTSSTPSVPVFSMDEQTSSVMTSLNLYTAHSCSSVSSDPLRISLNRRDIFSIPPDSSLSDCSFICDNQDLTKPLITKPKASIHAPNTSGFTAYPLIQLDPRVSETPSVYSLNSTYNKAENSSRAPEICTIEGILGHMNNGEETNSPMIFSDVKETSPIPSQAIPRTKDVEEPENLISLLTKIINKIQALHQATIAQSELQTNTLFALVENQIEFSRKQLLLKSASSKLRRRALLRRSYIGGRCTSTFAPIAKRTRIQNILQSKSKVSLNSSSEKPIVCKDIKKSRSRSTTEHYETTHPTSELNENIETIACKSDETTRKPKFVQNKVLSDVTFDNKRQIFTDSLLNANNESFNVEKSESFTSEPSTCKKRSNYNYNDKLYLDNISNTLENSSNISGLSCEKQCALQLEALALAIPHWAQYCNSYTWHKDRLLGHDIHKNDKQKGILLKRRLKEYLDLFLDELISFGTTDEKTENQNDAVYVLKEKKHNCAHVETETDDSLLQSKKAKENCLNAKQSNTVVNHNSNSQDITNCTHDDNHCATNYQSSDEEVDQTTTETLRSYYQLNCLRPRSYNEYNLLSFMSQEVVSFLSPYDVDGRIKDLWDITSCVLCGFYDDAQNLLSPLAIKKIDSKALQQASLRLKQAAELIPLWTARLDIFRAKHDSSFRPLLMLLPHLQSSTFFQFISSYIPIAQKQLSHILKNLQEINVKSFDLPTTTKLFSTWIQSNSDKSEDDLREDHIVSIEEQTDTLPRSLNLTQYKHVQKLNSDTIKLNQDSVSQGDKSNVILVKKGEGKTFHSVNVQTLLSSRSDSFASKNLVKLETVNETQKVKNLEQVINTYQMSSDHCTNQRSKLGKNVGYSSQLLPKETVVLGQVVGDVNMLNEAVVTIGETNHQQKAQQMNCLCSSDSMTSPNILSQNVSIDINNSRGVYNRNSVPPFYSSTAATPSQSSSQYVRLLPTISGRNNLGSIDAVALSKVASLKNFKPLSTGASTEYSSCDNSLNFDQAQQKRCPSYAYAAHQHNLTTNNIDHVNNIKQTSNTTDLKGTLSPPSHANEEELYSISSDSCSSLQTNQNQRIISSPYRDSIGTSDKSTAVHGIEQNFNIIQSSEGKENLNQRKVMVMVYTEKPSAASKASFLLQDEAIDNSSSSWKQTNRTNLKNETTNSLTSSDYHPLITFSKNVNSSSQAQSGSDRSLVPIAASPIVMSAVSTMHSNYNRSEQGMNFNCVGFQQPQLIISQDDKNIKTVQSNENALQKDSNVVFDSNFSMNEKPAECFGNQRPAWTVGPTIVQPPNMMIRKSANTAQLDSSGVASVKNYLLRPEANKLETAIDRQVSISLAPQHLNFRMHAEEKRINRTGIQGVILSADESSWIAFWEDPVTHQQQVRHFPIVQFGAKCARKMAIKCRRDADRQLNAAVRGRQQTTYVGTSGQKKDNQSPNVTAGVSNKCYDHHFTQLPRSEIPGVYWYRNRNGWVAQWFENGKNKHKFFAASVFGVEGAKQKAIAYRLMKLEEKRLKGW